MSFLAVATISLAMEMLMTSMEMISLALEMLMTSMEMISLKTLTLPVKLIELKFCLPTS